MSNDYFQINFLFEQLQ